MGKHIFGWMLGLVTGLMLGAGGQYLILDRPTIHAAQQDEMQANGLEDVCKQTLNARK